ncbi:hypothetical protein GPECTOR_1g652 [Gonium pectorale]|uniref:Calcineurin-like phosphoesterase domain-containing protein n=1 Tax=Gonium pectorale TaxID=33097 RepID=A0A150H3U2_GONPE|nr:hypothetical protein GPECTOR_1g652 [Gonium pectorale]|eukprot:KXZ56724.1 hypothetical protein GPECTOR_1g652 [Gonium pectorale]
MAAEAGGAAPPAAPGPGSQYGTYVEAVEILGDEGEDSEEHDDQCEEGEDEEDEGEDEEDDGEEGEEDEEDGEEEDEATDDEEEEGEEGDEGELEEVDPVYLQTAVYRNVPNVGRVYDWKLQHEVNQALSKQRKQQAQMEKVMEAARVQLQVREANERAFQQWLVTKKTEKQQQHQEHRRIAYVTSVYRSLTKDDPTEQKAREALWASTSASPRGSDAQDPPTYVTATGRIIAIGDLHGDLDKAVESLKLGGVLSVGEEGEVSWVGGDTVVVQLGDVLDRGDVEIGIVNLLRFLDTEARKHGGAVYMLNGNHESLNVCGDFRYVTPGAFAESAMYSGLSEDDLKDWQLVARVRYALFKPGGEMARELSRNPTVLIVNDTVFAHGGLLPTHVEYGVERLNREVAAWMRGDETPDGQKSPPPFLAMGDANSVMWNRSLSKERFATPFERYHACRALQQALAKVQGKRLVVGHTPQLTGANCECDDQVWRIDVGMSYGVLNRPVQVLEIAPSADGEPKVRIIRNRSGSLSSIDDDLASSL